MIAEIDPSLPLLISAVAGMIGVIFQTGRSMRKAIRENRISHGEVLNHLRKLGHSVGRVSSIVGLNQATDSRGAFETDAAGACVWVNEAWTEITGMSAIDARGDGWSRGIHTDDRRHIETVWSNSIFDGSRFGPIDYRFVRPDETVVHVRGCARPIFDLDDHITGWVGTVAEVGTIPDLPSTT